MRSAYGRRVTMSAQVDHSSAKRLLAENMPLLQQVASLSISELAAGSGLSGDRLISIQNCTSEVYLDDLDRLADAFRMPVAALFAIQLAEGGDA